MGDHRSVRFPRLRNDDLDFENTARVIGKSHIKGCAGFSKWNSIDLEFAQQEIILGASSLALVNAELNLGLVRSDRRESLFFRYRDRCIAMDDRFKVAWNEFTPKVFADLDS